MSKSFWTLARKEIEGSRRMKKNELKKEERESNNNNDNNININRVKTMDNNPKRTQSVLNYTLHFCHQVHFCQNTGFFCLPHKTAHKLKKKKKKKISNHTHTKIYLKKIDCFDETFRCLSRNIFSLLFPISV